MGKRILDVLLTLVAAPVWLTVVAIVTIILVALGQSPFYVQERLGRHGRVFRMIKFRTMVQDADIALDEFLAQNAEARTEWEVHQKLKNDPRITPFGRFLRKSSIDELPQLFNVLSGHMSLVGPRPMLVDQRMMYPGNAYFDLRPGLTGPWQVSDRNNCEFWERAEYDTRYASEQTFGRDVGLLYGTVAVVFRGTGY